LIFFVVGLGLGRDAGGAIGAGCVCVCEIEYDLKKTIERNKSMIDDHNNKEYR